MHLAQALRPFFVLLLRSGHLERMTSSFLDRSDVIGSRRRGLRWRLCLNQDLVPKRGKNGEGEVKSFCFVGVLEEWEREVMNSPQWIEKL